MGDIFEEVSAAVGAPYISSLHTEPYMKKAAKYLKHRSLTGIPLQKLSELISYIFGSPVEFDSEMEAVAYLNNVSRA